MKNLKMKWVRILTAVFLFIGGTLSGSVGSTILATDAAGSSSSTVPATNTESSSVAPSTESTSTPSSSSDNTSAAVKSSESAAVSSEAIVRTPAVTSTMAQDVSLNIGATEDEMGVAWFTADEKAALRYWKDGRNVKDAIVLTSARNVRSSTRDGQPWSHQVTLKALIANSTYHYQFGTPDSSEQEWSGVFDFTTKAFDSASTAFSFLYAGDPQIGASKDNLHDRDGWAKSLLTATQMFPSANFLLSLGDQINTGSDETQYDYFLNHDALHTLPLAAVQGNHETYGFDDSTPVSVNPYLEHYALPNMSAAGAAAHTGGDYYFTYGNVLFVGINSNNLSTAEHKNFMDAVLKAHPKAAWKVLAFHHSLYSVASHAVDEDILQRRETLAPLIKQLGFDVVLQGHDHVYVRSKLMDGLTPIEPGTPNQSVFKNPKGVLYMTANSGSGSKFYTIKDMEFPFAAVKNQEKVPNISQVQVTPTSFKITTYRMSDQSIVDTVELVKESVVTPTNPSESSKPSQTATPTKPSAPAPSVTVTHVAQTTHGKTIPKTGENTFLYAGLGLLLLLLAGCVYLLRRKHKQN